MVTSETTTVFLPAEQFVGWRLDDIVPGDRCSGLVDMLAARGFEATGVRYPDNYRNNDRLVFDDPALAASLFDATRSKLPAVLDIEGERWVLDGLNTRFRACRYAGGQSFCIHRDGPHAPEEDVRSHLTLQLYLDDDRDRVGGHTRFYADPRGEHRWASIAPRRGTAIVFDHRAWHDGEPVTNGVKHVLRTDVMYRRAGNPPEAETCDMRVLYRHRGYAWQAIVCRNGSIASGGRDGALRRWSEGCTPTTAEVDLRAGSVTRVVEASDGRLWCGTRAGALFVIEGLTAAAVVREAGAILGLAPRPDGGVVVATALGELVAFERNGACAWRRRVHDGWAWAVISDGSGYLSCGDAGQIVAVDDAGVTTAVARLDVSLRALAMIGDEVAIGDAHGTLHRFGRDGRRREAHPAHRGAITALAAGRNGCVISGSEDGCVHVWAGTVRQGTIRTPDFVTSVATDHHDNVICASYDGAIVRAPLARS